MSPTILLNQQRTLFLFLAFSALLIFLGYIFAHLFQTPLLLWLAVALSFLSSLVGYFYSDKIALSVSGAKPLKKGEHPELVLLVKQLSRKENLSVPAIYLIDDPSPNALATGRDPRHAAVAVTSGLLKLLNQKELSGVIAHELSHIKNYDILVATLAVVLAGAITLLSDWFLRFHFWRGGRGREGGNLLAVLGLVLAILAPIFAILLQLAISRKREFLADASGAILIGRPAYLISALKKIGASPHRLRKISRATAHLFIVNPLSSPWGERVVAWWSSHPPLKQRIESLRKLEL